MTEVQPIVVIIEADEATRRLYERALSTVYDVLAASPEMTWEAMTRRLPIRAIAIEPGPEGEPGWDLIRELRRRPETQATPIILCTSQDDRGLDQELGVTAHLVKPVLPTDLLAVIQSILADASS